MNNEQEHTVTTHSVIAPSSSEKPTRNISATVAPSAVQNTSQAALSIAPVPQPVTTAAIPMKSASAINGGIISSDITTQTTSVASNKPKNALRVENVSVEEGTIRRRSDVLDSNDINVDDDADDLDAVSYTHLRAHET